ncbi:MAG: C10 family peptidase, partial [Candidatus Eisenbacteria bacterium]|nr:C10 family peptidase [Candidatus Eisenbacteria bacterium]
MISTRPRARIAFACFRTSLVACAAFAAPPPIFGAPLEVDPESARQVCSNWIHRVAAGSSQARGFERTIATQQPLTNDRGIIGHLFQLVPNGWVVVPARRTLSPIVAWAETGKLETDAEEGLPLLVREQLSRAVDQPWAAAPEWRAQAWSALESAVPRTGHAEDDAGATMIELGGPLLQSAWHQGEPFQDLCPMGDGGRTVVGCVATAAAQILRYYQWPPSGEGTFSYAWAGDTSCHGAAVPSTLTADFTDPYDWANMPLITGEDETPAQRAAVAELCYEMAVALEMNFGRCNSASNPDGVGAALVQHFRFNPALETVTRLARSRLRWYEMIREEIDRGRPLFYNITNHSLVADGYQKVDAQLFYHVNYGWGGSNNAWFAIDEVPGLSDPLLEFMTRRIAPAEQVHHLRPDGAGAFRSLADALIGVLDSEIIELDDGIYRGDGFRDLVLPDRPLIIRSRSGDPERCIIDAAASDQDPHSIIARMPTAPPGVTVEGITFRGAHDTRPGGKGAILCNGGQTRFINCRFENNRGAIEGGAVYISEARPVFEDCVFVGNEPHGVECFDSAPVFRRCIFTGHDRSSLRAHQSDVVLEQCTFAWNRARDGDLRVHSLADLVARNCLFAFSGGQA